MQTAMNSSSGIAPSPETSSRATSSLFCFSLHDSLHPAGLDTLGLKPPPDPPTRRVHAFPTCVSSTASIVPEPSQSNALNTVRSAALRSVDVEALGSTVCGDAGARFGLGREGNAERPRSRLARSSRAVTFLRDRNAPPPSLPDMRRRGVRPWVSLRDWCRSRTLR